MAAPPEIPHGWSPFLPKHGKISLPLSVSLCLLLQEPGSPASSLKTSNWSLASLLIDQETNGE